MFCKHMYICNVIRETIHKVVKCDFEIFMPSRRGENEKYSKKKNYLTMSRYGVPKVKIAKSY